ncbi:histidine kinase [Streptomyces sp. NPDC005438]|uniref:sensor histidine kinase n=1 Tax=Streptomyces sp. NPDC005438 TaxID=3156880 RepID=UPI0033A463FA
MSGTQVETASSYGPRHPWMLPSSLVAELTPTSGGRRRVRRTVRDWVVDVLCFLLVSVFAPINMHLLAEQGNIPDFWMGLEVVLGLLSVPLVWLRRRWPVGLAVVMAVMGSFAECTGGTGAVALFTLAVHRPFRYVAWVGSAYLVGPALIFAFRPDPELGYLPSLAFAALVNVTIIGWGMYTRSRRQLLLSLRNQARRAENEAVLRVEQAQGRAREAIAREMHDVLAHRLTLLSVHAGALEFRPTMSSEEVARAAGVMRESAHEALQDLREIIGVLRAGEQSDDSSRPQPTLAALERLVEESRDAHARVSLDCRVEEPEEVPVATGRTAYRVVQEGLTNARKHAPGTEVRVRVAGKRGEGLTVELSNPAPSGEVPEVPGSGQGLIGLAERASLAGGRLEHGREPDGGFRVSAWLPWG